MSSLATDHWPLTTAVALGSNLGDRAATLAAAVQRLRATPRVRVLAVSRLHETAPVGGPAESGAYLNGALVLETTLEPLELLETLLHVERHFGRQRSVPDAPRTLDLDLLLYGDRVLDTPALTLPHPRMHLRRFVLAPLAEVAPNARHSVLGKTVAELLAELPPEPPLSEPAELPWRPRLAVLDLAGQTALVTGSSSGIGLAIARELAAAGAAVVTHARTPGRADVAADLGTDAGVAALITAVADADILVCNAGADVLTGDAAGWDFARKLDELWRVDVRATATLSRHYGARMKARGRGVILTMGWDQAETGMAGDSGQFFALAKGAVMAFTRSLALELAPAVRVNCLAPGWTRTAWGETASPAWQERVRAETPLQVWGLPEDIAAAAHWLASPASGYVTGQVVRLNGGAVRG